MQKKTKYNVHILALGDVGATLLLGLKLLGGDILSSIGIYDVRDAYTQRYEQEMNQIALPFEPDALPPVHIVEQPDLFACDMFVFCASGGVPEVGGQVADVRMAQLEVNERIIKIYARLARESGFKGIFAVVSDPVDLLCQCVYYESNKAQDGRRDTNGLQPGQVRGYGIGVMHARALYLAKQDERFASYQSEGRAFGPHGKRLIIANSIAHYDASLSKELTQRVVGANMRMREIGFKPYIAPAISSGVFSLLATLRGDWHYSAIYRDGIYFGCKNRETANGAETEALELPQELQEHIESVLQNLREEGARWR